ncbi:MAG: sugar transferase [Pseudomonadota bacterium]
MLDTVSDRGRRPHPDALEEVKGQLLPDDGKQAESDNPHIARDAHRCTTSKVKRTLDIVVSGAAIVVLSPLLALIALGLAADRNGSIVFRQERSGLHGSVFCILKFRTMRPLQKGVPFAQTSGRDDERVTGLGKILRRTSLDELPQLWNVLKGDMSLVGPRPHPVELDRGLEDKDQRYPLRLLVKPGLTGLAQINNARGPITDDKALDRRLTLDLAYIRDWSIGRDFKLLTNTLGYVFAAKRDAY